MKYAENYCHGVVKFLPLFAKTFELSLYDPNPPLSSSSSSSMMQIYERIAGVQTSGPLSRRLLDRGTPKPDAERKVRLLPRGRRKFLE